MGVQDQETRRRRVLRLPSPAICIAVLALFVALSSGAYATTRSGGHGPKGIVNAQDIAFNTITSAEIKNGSLLPADMASSVFRRLKGTRGAAGPAGPQGLKGDKGDRGTDGVNGQNAFSTLTYKSASGTLAPQTYDGATAFCPANMHVVGGGVAVSNTDNEGVISSFPSVDSGGNFTSYTGYAYNASTSTSYGFAVVAICVPSSQALGKAGTANALLRTAH